jgi:flavin-dependent dehydrogenase
VCKQLLSNSCFKFKKDRAVSVSEKILKTENNQYKFKYLIDCTGSHFFLKKQLKQFLPFRYWVGTTRVLNNTIKTLDKRYYYFLFDDWGFLEEFYLLKDKTLHGFWQYTKKIDFNLINPPKQTFLKKYIPQPEIVESHNVIGPCAPVFPLTYKNYAFLGDSFGNATSSSAVGIVPILYSSKLLADSIKQDNINLFEKYWKKRYLKPYLLYLTSRLDRYHNSKFIKIIKGYPRNSEILKEFKHFPNLFSNFLEGDSIVKIPGKLKEKFPKHMILWQVYYYIMLKLRYLFYETLNNYIPLLK